MSTMLRVGIQETYEIYKMVKFIEAKAKIS